MEVLTSRKIVYLNNPNIENDMNDEYSYFPDKPTSPIFNKQSPLTFNKGFEPTKTDLKIPEFKLTKDKKDTIIPQLRTETKTDLRKETFGTKNPIVETTTEEEEVNSKKEGMCLAIYLIVKNK
jgi:hypothetical protein